MWSTIPMEGIGIIILFVATVLLISTRRLSALLALPLLSLGIAIIARVPFKTILDQVIGEGMGRLHVAMVAVILGSMLGQLLSNTGISAKIVRFAAEFGGDRPLFLALTLTIVAAILFTTLSGLGAFIMVASIILPVMLSVGISPLVAGCLFLFGLSFGGVFNLVNWQIYIEVLKIPLDIMTKYAVMTGGLYFLLILVFLYLHLGNWRKQWWHLVIAFALFGLIAMNFTAPEAHYQAAIAPTEVTGLRLWLNRFCYMLFTAIAFKGWYQGRTRTTPTPWAGALLTPIIPLILVLLCGWNIIPAFVATLAFGTLATWNRTQLQRFTLSLFDGFSSVGPAVILMFGIGMILKSVTQPEVVAKIMPIVQIFVPESKFTYVLVFTIGTPLALYRGPLNLWGMGSGLIGLLQGSTSMPPASIMATLFSVGQVQSVSDPTNTHNVWLANHLNVDVTDILKKTIPYMWPMAFVGLVFGAMWFF